MRDHDKSLVYRRFADNFATYDKLATVQRRIADRLYDEIEALGPAEIGRGMEIGAGTGFLTRQLLGRHPETSWYLNDLVEQSEPYLLPYTEERNATFIWGDAEGIALPAGLDLTASASVFQWFDDLEGFVAKVSAATRGGGMFAFATFGRRNFHEIRTLTGEGLDYFDLSELEAMAARHGFRTLKSYTWIEEEHFSEPIEVLRYIKAIGVNAVGTRRWTPNTLARFSDDYRRIFGEITLTYEPLVLVAEKM